MRPKLVIVGNPRCRRVGFWHAALRARHWPEAEVVPYVDLLRGQACLAEHLSTASVVRFESAAENWDTFKHLLKHGAIPAREEGYPVMEEVEIERLQYERGWLVKPRQCYLGMVRLIRTLSRDVAEAGAAALHSADDIATCFDKPRCQVRLGSAKIPIPTALPSPRDYLELRAQRGCAARVMLKLAHGSGAAGCVALHWSQGRVRALTTTVELTIGGQNRLYCSKKVRVLCQETEIAALIDRLCVEKVQVEQWLPKARWQGHNFDLRILTIAGVPRHTVARVSTSIFTNLTLGGRRGDVSAIMARMGPEAWQRVRVTAQRVAAAFPRSFTLGIDLLVHPDFRRHAVLEVNAFGDLLLHSLDGGEDTYTATLAAWERDRESNPQLRART